ncbi:MAG TPA: ATP-binding cassette domain-containing protein, partial [Actinomycetota bacterium]|nr:ATP-binding cassette domain-containing protein [Actinomycetota bacterium]
FGPQVVLEEISCDIPKGKITLMLGPSGTGKSVFLKHLMGLLKPDRGEIWIDGKNLPELSHRELYAVRRKFGVLFQDGALFGSMNIYDNVAFPLREHTRKSEREIREIVSDKLGMVGLTGAEGKLPGQISGGMKKRAGLARALVLDPEIVLFDEPDSGLDPVRTAFLNELILDLNRKLGPTMVVVTHDIATARRVADFIGMLYLRNLIYFGSKQECFDCDVPAVRQFLSGDTRGPIGMSEEADQGRRGADAVSTYGMTAEETEELEREAGAPEASRRQEESRGPEASRRQEESRGPEASRRQEESRGPEEPPQPTAGTKERAPQEVMWIPEVEPEEEVPLGDLFGRRREGDGHRQPARRRSGGR